MKKTSRIALGIFVGMVGFTPLWSEGTRDQKMIESREDRVFKIGDTQIHEIWARATGGKNGAVFMVLENPKSDRLIQAKVEGDVCERVELHAHKQEGDVMRMREVEEIEIKGTTVLKPGGLHIMLLGLKAPLSDHSIIKMTLIFEQAGLIDIEIPVHKRNPYNA